jgi:hypothetical protein
MADPVARTIEDLDPAASADLAHVFMAMLSGVTSKLTLSQVVALVRANLAETAPGTLDTIDEIAAALGDDPDAITNILTQQALRLKRDGSNFADEAERQTFRGVLRQLSHGQCYLSLQSSTLLQLAREGGKYLIIDGTPQEIPETPITCDVTGATAAALYYIYAYMSGSTMTLERSTTARVFDAATGVWVKTGDTSRTFVGLAMPATGPVWVNTSTDRWVTSYFNRRPRSMRSASISFNTSSTSWAEASGYISWIELAEDHTQIIANGSIYSSTAGQVSYLGVGVDGASPGGAYGDRVKTQTSYYDPACVFQLTGGVDAKHYASLWLSATSGYTATVNEGGISAVCKG